MGQAMATHMQAGNEDFIPAFEIDVKELLTFRTWAASGWVRVAFYISLCIVCFTAIMGFIWISYESDFGVAFFGVIIILLCCGGSLLYHRIFFEMIMGCLQIPRLI